MHRPPRPPKPLAPTSLLIPLFATGLASHRAHAQLEILQPPPTLPSLPDPPGLQHALLENPIPLVIATTAVALAAYALASRAGRRRLGLISGSSCALLGLLALLLSLLIRTDRERIAHATRSLVTAVAEVDLATLDSLLEPDARLYVAGDGGRDKGQILSWIRTYLSPPSPYTVESHRVSEVQTEVGPSGQLGRTRATVSITPADDAPTRIVCMLTWRKNGAGGWGIVEIDPLWLLGWGEITDGDMTREIGR